MREACRGYLVILNATPAPSLRTLNGLLPKTDGIFRYLVCTCHSTTKFWLVVFNHLYPSVNLRPSGISIY